MDKAEAKTRAGQLEALAAYYDYLATAYERLEPGSQMAKTYANEAKARLRAAKDLRAETGTAA